MRPESDPARLTADERLHEVAAILAAGILRLRDRAALTSSSPPENPSETGENSLEAVPENPLSVHVG